VFVIGEPWRVCPQGSLQVSPPGNVSQVTLRACRLTYGADASAGPTGMASFRQRAEILLGFHNSHFHLRSAIVSL